MSAHQSSVDLESLSYQELQEECREANLSASGTKQKLKQRLRSKISHNKRAATGSSVNVGPKKKKTRKSLAEDLICPITLELPIDPVMAEDGRVYDRCAIERHFEEQEGSGDANNVYGGEVVKSPMTNEPMGNNLIPAIQTKNLIESMIENGDIEGNLVDSWKERMDERAEVEELKQKADSGDADAAYKLGEIFQYGLQGVSEDVDEAQYWYGKAADGGNVPGMAIEADNILDSDPTTAVALMSLAAEGGSDFAGICLGEWFANGEHGLLKNRAQAKRLLEKVVNGDCAYHHARECHYEAARRLLIKLS